MGWLEKGVALYGCIAIAIMFAYPSVIFNAGQPADSTVLSWFNIRLDSNNQPSFTAYANGATTLSDTANNATTSLEIKTVPSAATGGGTILGFIDPLYQVLSWFKLFFKILFSPLIIMTSIPNVPIAAQIMFGFLPTLMMLVGLIVWIRSGQS